MDHAIGTGERSESVEGPIVFRVETGIEYIYIYVYVYEQNNNNN